MLFFFPVALNAFYFGRFNPGWKITSKSQQNISTGSAEHIHVHMQMYIQPNTSKTALTNSSFLDFGKASNLQQTPLNLPAHITQGEF